MTEALPWIVAAIIFAALAYPAWKLGYWIGSKI
jgi:hypothetical protein